MPMFAFLDESGDYAFNGHGTKFNVYTGVVTNDPTQLTDKISELRYRLHASGRCLERFHACTDHPGVRKQLFDVLEESTSFEVHSVVVRKNRVNPSLYPHGIYCIAYRTMLKYLAGSGPFRRKIDSLHMIVDTVPAKKQHQALKGSLTDKALEALGPHGFPYTIHHHSSGSHALLQVSDYCAWAIQRKWSMGCEFGYSKIKSKIRNEFDIYASGGRDYY